MDISKLIKTGCFLGIFIIFTILLTNSGYSLTYEHFVNAYNNTYTAPFLNPDNARIIDGSTADSQDPTADVSVAQWWNLTTVSDQGTINTVWFSTRNAITGAVGSDEWTYRWQLATTPGECAMDSGWNTIAGPFSADHALTYYNVTGSITWTDLDNVCFDAYYNRVAGDDDIETQIDAFWVKIDYTPLGDPIPPNVTINSPINASNYSGNIIINATVLDNIGVNETGVFYRLVQGTTNKTPWTDMTNTSSGNWSIFNTTLISTSVSDGTYNVSINASDNSSTKNTTEFVTITIDNTPPLVGYVEPSQDETKTDSFLINVSVNDSTSGVESVYYWIENESGNVTPWTDMSFGTGTIYIGYWNATFDPSALAYGTYNITTNATDFTDNQNTTVKRQFVYTTPLLNVTLITPASGSSQNVTQNTTFRVNASVKCLNGNCGTVTGSVRYNWTSANPDTWVNTTAGNKPFYNVTGEIPWSCGTLAKNDLCILNWSVNVTGTVGASFYLDANFTSSLGTVSDNNTDNFQINISVPPDLTPPEVTINTPKTGENRSGSILINATVIDSDSGVDDSKVYYWLKNSSGNQTPWTQMSNLSSGNWQWYNATFVSTSIYGGTYNITINASDASGNENITESVIIDIDNTNPYVGIVSPIPDANISNSFLLNVSVNDSVAGAETVQYRVENSSGNVTQWKSTSLGSGTIYQGYWDATVNEPSLADGVYNITINATDFTGNENTSQKVQVILDSGKPAVGIVSPAAGLNVSNNLLVNASVNDTASGTSTVEFWFENSSANVTPWTSMSLEIGDMNQGYWNATFNTNTISDGTYNITINATDFAGNENTSQGYWYLQITVDNNKPNVGFIEPEIDANISSNFLLNASVNDSGTGINTMVYRTENGSGNLTPWTTMSLNSGSVYQGFWDATVDISSLVNGPYNITLNATDYAGKSNTSQKSQFIVDKIIPSVGIVDPIDGENYSGNVLINTSVNDSDSGAFTSVFRFSNGSGNVTSWTSMSLTSGTIYQGYWTASFDTSTLADGFYNITINATDFAGNENTSQRVEINVSSLGDVFPPNVTINSPVNASNYSGNIIINVSVIDDIGVNASGVFYRLVQGTTNKTPWTDMTNTSSGNWSIFNTTLISTSVSDGVYNVSINASDNSSNENTTEFITITIDNNPPSVTINEPTDNDAVSGIFEINATVLDAVSIDSSKIFYRIETPAANYTPWTLMYNSTTENYSVYNASYNSAQLSDGYYNISINASDFIGNENSTEFITIQVDNIPPEVTINEPTSNQVVSNIFEINITVLDSSTVDSSKVFFRIETPAANYTPWTAMLNSTTENYSVFNVSYDPSGLADGFYNVTINASDTLGNENTTEFVTIQVDSIPPEVVINEPIDDQNVSGVFEINITVLDSSTVDSSKVFFRIETPAANYTPWTLMYNSTTENYSVYNASYNSAQLSDGYYNITINASDTTGNENSTEFITINIDNTPPNIVISIPAENQNLSVVTIWVNGTITDEHKVDNNPTINDSRFSLDNYDSATGSYSFDNNTQISDGTISVNVSFTDDLGTSNTSDPRTFVVDNTNPEIAFVQPSLNENFSSNFLLNISANDTTSGLSFVYYRVENGSGNLTPWSSMTLTGNINVGWWDDTVDVSSLYDGPYNLSINSSDFTNNTNTSVKRQFTLDTAKPLVGIINPAFNQNASGNLLINVSVNDSGSGVMSVYNRIENSSGNVTSWTLVTEGPTGFWTYTFDTATLADGYYNVSINASDYTGNENSSEKQQFQIDNALPYINITKPVESENISADNITINGSVVDANKNENNPEINDSRFSLGSYDTASGDFTFYNSSQVADGTISISVNFTDDAGNTNSSSRGFVVDNTIPSVSIEYPSPNQNISGTVVINASIDDSASGVKESYFWFENGSGNVTPWTSMSLVSGTIYSGVWNESFDTSSLANGLYNITINSTDFTDNQNASSKVEVSIIRAAYVNSIDVFPDNPTDGQNLNCSWVASSDGGGSLTANVTWYEGGVMDPSYNSTNVVCGNGSICYATVLVNASSTDPGEVWTCVVAVKNVWGESASGNASETIQTPGGPSLPGVGIGGGGFIEKEKKEKHYVRLIEKGEKKGINVKNVNDYKITKIELMAGETITGMTFSIDQITPLPEFPESLGTFYSYANLSATVPQESFSAIIINFRVDKYWLSKENFSSDAVLMFKESREEWQKLPTLQTGEDNNFNYYATLTSNFSIYVIAASRPPEAPCEKTCPYGQTLNPYTCACEGVPAICGIVCPEGTLLDVTRCICVMPIVTEKEGLGFDPWISILGALGVVVLALLIILLLLGIKTLARKSGIKISFYER